MTPIGHVGGLPLEELVPVLSSLLAASWFGGQLISAYARKLRRLGRRS